MKPYNSTAVDQYTLDHLMEVRNGTK